MPIGDKKEIDVNIQSQTSSLFQYFLMQEQKTDITLTSPVSIDDTVINVSSGHGFTAAAGEYMVIRNGDIFSQAKVISVSVDAITIETPIANAYPVSAGVIRGNILMNVDGSGGDIEFLYTSACCGAVTPLIPVDLSTVVITMQHGANVPDDGKFGGLAALAKGMYFRKKNASRVNLGNYTTNQDFKDRGAVVEYTDKAPAGTNATNITFEIEEVFGQVVRIDPRLTEDIQAIIRDKVDAGEGMAKMTISLIGSLTKGE